MPTRQASRPQLTVLPSRRNGAAPRIALVARGLTATNVRLLRALVARGADVRWLTPDGLDGMSVEADVLLSRLDIRPTLDGVERGWWKLNRLELDGLPVLNATDALLACHDKLMTAFVLARDDVPHPRTALVDTFRQLSSFAWPLVLKPRFGSWGRGVALLHGRHSLERHLKRIRREPWFRRHGALVQEFVPADGTDLRVIVAGDEVIGAVRRVAPPGEWRTNVSLGGRRLHAVPSPEASAVAVAAVRAVGADLAGVDLLQRPDGRYVVLEVNGAVEFTPEYALDGTNPFLRAADLVVHAASRAVSAPLPAAGVAVA